MPGLIWERQWASVKPPTVSDNAVIIARNAKRTSIDAAMRKYPETGSLRLRIYELLVRAGLRGVTDYEIEATLSIPGNSVRPLRKSLETQGFIIDSGLTRKNQNGNECTIWRAVDEGMML